MQASFCVLALNLTGRKKGQKEAKKYGTTCYLQVENCTTDRLQLS